MFWNLPIQFEKSPGNCRWTYIHTHTHTYIYIYIYIYVYLYIYIFIYEYVYYNKESFLGGKFFQELLCWQIVLLSFSLLKGFSLSFFLCIQNYLIITHSI